MTTIRLIQVLALTFILSSCANKSTHTNAYQELDKEFASENRLPASENNSDIFYADSQVQLSREKLQNALMSTFEAAVEDVVIYKKMSEKLKFLDVFGAGSAQVWSYIQFKVNQRYSVRCDLTYFKGRTLLLSSCVSQPAAIFKDQIIDIEKISTSSDQ